MIEFHNVTAYQQQLKVFDSLSLTIEEGERVAILGPNGAGKSTLLKLVTREIYPVDKENSHLKLFGNQTVDIWDLRSKLGLVSQDLQEDYTSFTTGLDVVISGFFGSIGTHNHLHPTEEQIQQARKMLAAVEMEEYSGRMFQRLSTGQKRRLLLARSLVHRPSALILDEPANGLDMGASLALLQLMRKFCHGGRGMIITTHHLDEIIPEINRVILISKGTIVADGPKAEIISNENLSNLYETPLRVDESGGWYRCWHA